MKNLSALVFSFLLCFSVGAQQLSFDFGHADEILKRDFYPGDKELTKVALSDLPDVVAKEVRDLDVAFELADGYYDYLASAIYEIKVEGKVVGYMECSLLSYTEDPELTLTGVKFNLSGRRITGYGYDELTLNMFEDEFEAREYLPIELHPITDY